MLMRLPHPTWGRGTPPGHVDAVSRKLRIARLERDGSRRMLIPAGILLVALQIIPDLNDREQATHRDGVPEGSRSTFHRDGVRGIRHDLGHPAHVHPGV